MKTKSGKDITIAAEEDIWVAVDGSYVVTIRTEFDLHKRADEFGDEYIPTNDDIREVRGVIVEALLAAGIEWEKA